MANGSEFVELHGLDHYTKKANFRYCRPQQAKVRTRSKPAVRIAASRIRSTLESDDWTSIQLGSLGPSRPEKSALSGPRE